MPKIPSHLLHIGNGKPWREKVEGEGYELYLGDCLEVLPMLGKVDAIVTDFPYGNLTEYSSYEDTPENLMVLANKAVPLMREHATNVIFTTGVQFMWYFPKPDWILAWIVPSGTGCGPWGFCCWQPLFVYGKDPFLTAGLGSRPDTLVKYETSEKNGHPCPKPIGVWSWVVTRVTTKTDQTVIDTFMGSGTTGVACLQLNRRFVGIEIDPTYFAIAAKRIGDTERLLREGRELLKGGPAKKPTGKCFR